MFNLSGSEIVVILLLALVVLGPEKLPDAMRRAGRAFAEFKKLSSGFQDEVRKGFEEPIREVKETAATVRSAARFPLLDPKAADKPRYNPEVGPPPEPAAGSQVADPLEAVSPDAAEAADAADVADPLGDVSPDAAEAADAADPLGDVSPDAAEAVGGADDDASGEPTTTTAEADRTA